MITDRVRTGDLSSTPFPHFVVNDVLEDGLCRRLIEEMPSVEKITKGQPVGSNLRFNYTAANISQDPAISHVWREFVRQHTLQAFLDQVISVFKQHIINEHVQLAEKLDKLRAGVRYLDDYDSADVLLDVQIGINTPVTKPCSVRGPHLDDPRKLFAGLLYLRLEDDDSTGGDLQLYSPLNDYTLDNECSLLPELARVEKTVEYQRNSLLLFLNTARSFHGVTPRSVTPFPRLFINFVGEMREPIFDVKQNQRPSLAERLLQPFRRQRAA